MVSTNIVAEITSFLVDKDLETVELKGSVDQGIVLQFDKQNSDANLLTQTEPATASEPETAKQTEKELALTELDFSEIDDSIFALRMSLSELKNYFPQGENSAKRDAA